MLPRITSYNVCYTKLLRLAPIQALAPVCAPVRCHHERWDGTGYPARLGEGDIPELARIRNNFV